MPTLENWSVCCTDEEDYPYKAPECLNQRLQGNIYGHDKHVDGKFVVTSRLLNLSIEAKEGVTSNTIYALGKPSSGWLDWCAVNAKDSENYKKILATYKST